MVEAFFDLADRRMAGEYAAPRLPDRVRAIIAGRLDRMRPAKEAVRRALGLLLAHPATAARCHAPYGGRDLARGRGPERGFQLV